MVTIHIINASLLNIYIYYRETTVPGANSEGDRFIRPIAPSNTTPGNPAHQSDKKTTNNNEYQQADYDLAQTLHDQELAYQLQVILHQTENLPHIV